MAEKKSNIRQTDFDKGFYIEVNCQFCYREVIYGGATKTELSATLKNEGWKWLNSDEYGQCGYWCGCDYK
jgi:hypothetical protein